MSAHTYKLPGLGKMHVHRGKKSTAITTRNNVVAVYIPNIINKSAGVISDGCLECKKHGPTILEEQIVHHRTNPTAPWSKISIDLLGPFIVKATSKSRAKINVWALIILCKSTGLLTHQIIDSIAMADVIKGIWNHQTRHNILTVHIHADAGTQLKNLGDLGQINESGEIMRLVMILKL